MMTTFNVLQILTPIGIFFLTILCGVIGWFVVRTFNSHEATQKELKEGQKSLDAKIDEIGIGIVKLKAELVSEGKCLFKMANVDQKIHEVHKRIDEHLAEKDVA